MPAVSHAGGALALSKGVRKPWRLSQQRTLAKWRRCEQCIATLHRKHNAPTYLAIMSLAKARRRNSETIASAFLHQHLGGVG